MPGGGGGGGDSWVAPRVQQSGGPVEARGGSGQPSETSQREEFNKSVDDLLRKLIAHNLPPSCIEIFDDARPFEVHMGQPYLPQKKDAQDRPVGKLVVVRQMSHEIPSWSAQQVFVRDEVLFTSTSAEFWASVWMQQKDSLIISGASTSEDGSAHTREGLAPLERSLRDHGLLPPEPQPSSSTEA